ncbi:exosortase V [Sphingomonas montana]|uniref:exosortase V n=1 Tax=Sphingomonas montana TaxID=1843236 RepID=UPI0013EA2B8A|nr:exosortase V [Sphingomonas montana]
MMIQFAGMIRRPLPFARLLAISGMLAIAVPTMLTVARVHWTSQEGTQGPIILATTAWLLWRLRTVLSSESAPPVGMAWVMALVPLVLVHAFSRIYSILPIETASTYLIGLVAATAYFGLSIVRRFWFPFLYPAFLIVPPVSFAAELTLPLKLWISAKCVGMLHALGYPVALSGATIQIGQYELLVRQACAGLGSLVTLCAVGLFYVHLRREADLRSSVVLLVAIVPVAIAANAVRVAMLVLLTWYFGNGVGQGVAHEAAGLLMFCVAMALMFGISSALDALASDRDPRNG